MRWYPLSLERYFNNDGISSAGNFTDGDFDGLGNTFPAEELPAANLVVELAGVAVLFPEKRDGASNNLALEAQEIEVAPRHYGALAAIGAADSGRYAGGEFAEAIYFLYRDGGAEKQQLRLKDWNCIPGQRRGGVEAIRCRLMHTPSGKCVRTERGYRTRPTLWWARIELDEGRLLQKIVLPDNPCMHLFAMTLIVGSIVSGDKAGVVDSRSTAEF